ncbi:histidine-rich glycoprotein-like [Penaeus monodon]|uniref:histidine-rich glycoprotein-like n=1 Tax=Penaeus monodon TaxID=6687 RepID=UPI0018A78ADA|nr:histidine-rich glycoprotein-like [Penaeus monodon]
MKYLVFVFLVAAACASEVEKREAEPSTGYPFPPYGSHHSPHYHAGRYHPLHKRSAEPEAEAKPSNLYYPNYFHQTTVTATHHTITTRDLLKPSSVPINFHHHSSTPYQHIYTPYVNHTHKRSAEPSTTYHHYNHHYTPYVHHPHKRSAEPSTIYYPYYTTYSPYVHHPHKRSAEAKPTYHPAYDPYHYHGVTSGHGFHYRY